MKNLILLSLLFFTFSCATTKKTNESKEIITPIVGGDQDEHGCIGSAGYTWSSIKNECIRVFELPLQLKTLDEKSIIGVVFAEGSKKAEVINSGVSLILDLKRENYYENANNNVFLLKQNDNWVYGTISDKNITHKKYITH
jgi:hypothetical protein